MTTKYIAKHDGHTWKRNTANRTYTHAVIRKGNIAVERARQITASMRQFERDRAYLESVVAGTSGFSNTQDRIDSAKRELAAGADGVAKRASEWFDDNFLPKVFLASDGVSFYYNTASWAGRPDLAKQKDLNDIILVAEVVS